MGLFEKSVTTLQTLSYKCKYIFLLDFKLFKVKNFIDNKKKKYASR